VINNEDTARPFDVFFEVDDWKEIEEYALSGFNIVDDHCQYYQEPAVISTKHPSASPLSIPHKNPSAEPVVISHQLLATIPPEDGKYDDDNIAVDNRKPVAKTQEEMLTTAVQEHMLTNTNLNSLTIGGQVVPGSVSSVIHNSLNCRRGVELARDGKEVKGAYQIKRIIREQRCLTTRDIKGEGKGNC
jgi:hypothetical protein